MRQHATRRLATLSAACRYTPSFAYCLAGGILMKFRRFAVAFVCLLAVVGVAGAQQVCSPYMASGTYLMSLSGWATVAVTPMPIHVPIAVQGIVKVDDSGALTGVGPTISVAAGTPTVLTMTASNVTIAGDCTLTFKAT